MNSHVTMDTYDSIVERSQKELFEKKPTFPVYQAPHSHVSAANTSLIFLLCAFIQGGTEGKVLVQQGSKKC